MSPRIRRITATRALLLCAVTGLALTGCTSRAVPTTTHTVTTTQSAAPVTAPASTTPSASASSAFTNGGAAAPSASASPVARRDPNAPKGQCADSALTVRFCHQGQQLEARAVNAEVLVLRCLEDATLVPAAARDIRVGQATGCRYFHEGIDIIADHAPDLTDVLSRAAVEGWSHIELDGTLIPTTRLAERDRAGQRRLVLRQTQAARRDLQVLYDPHGSRSVSPPSSPAAFTTSPRPAGTCSRP